MRRFPYYMLLSVNIYFTAYAQLMELPKGDSDVVITLVTPAGDPVNSPVDSGDGQNEFTYSPQTPGVLTVNLKAQIVKSPDSPDQIKDNVYFAVEAINGSTMEWNEANPGGKPTVNGDYLLATATFTCLPADNSDFGAKKAAIYYDGSKQDEKPYEVFFHKDERNHPGDTLGGPNWFYYWNKTIAGDSRCVYSDNLPQSAGNTKTSMGVYDQDTDIPHIGPGAGIFDIDYFARVVIHELRHQQDYLNTHGSMAQPDWDGDWIADNLETDRNWDQGKTEGGLTDLALEVWDDNNMNGLVDIREDKGLLAYVQKAGELPSVGLILKDNLKVDQESLSGTTSRLSINTYKNRSESCPAEGIIQISDVEWWAQYAEKQWVTGFADLEDWADPGENHGEN